jgi:hypothetical protein
MQKLRVFIVKFLLLIALVFALSYGLTYLIRQREFISQQSEPTKESILMKKIAKHIDLEIEGEPKFALITDIKSLKSKSNFFDNSQNGQYLVIFEKLVVVYDPVSDTIISRNLVATDEGSVRK